MFESFKFNSLESKSKKENEILLNYAEIAKNRKEIEERKRKEDLERGLKSLGKEAESLIGAQKAREAFEREALEKDFEHKS